MTGSVDTTVATLPAFDSITSGCIQSTSAMEGVEIRKTGHMNMSTIVVGILATVYYGTETAN